MSRPAVPGSAKLRVGDQVEVELGSIVPGGHCLARHAGRTMFVRHGIPGEQVLVTLTAVSAKAIFADVVDVMHASRDRVVPPCKWVGRCGGCDLQHVAGQRQRDLKASIIKDTLRRQGGLSVSDIEGLRVAVNPLDDDLVNWRTSVRWHRDHEGHAGFRGWREREVIPVTQCPVLREPLRDAMDSGEGTVARLGSDGQVGMTSESTTQVVHGRSWEINSSTFWQSHVHAPEVLVDAVMDHARPQPGERWVDLYAGAGLFSAFLGICVGPEGAVTAIESSPSAIADGRLAMSDLPQVRLVDDDAGRWQPVANLAGIVLDPPRTGATPALLSSIVKARPDRIVYVSCDPVTFARDVKILATDYRLVRLDAFDAFPMTHHVETVATLLPI